MAPGEARGTPPPITVPIPARIPKVHTPRSLLPRGVWVSLLHKVVATPPLAQCARKNFPVDALNNIANPITSQERLNSVRQVVRYKFDISSETNYAHTVQRGGPGHLCHPSPPPEISPTGRAECVVPLTAIAVCWDCRPRSRHLRR